MEPSSAAGDGGCAAAAGAGSAAPVELPARASALLERSRKRTLSTFAPGHNKRPAVAPTFPSSDETKIAVKIVAEYAAIKKEMDDAEAAMITRPDATTPAAAGAGGPAAEGSAGGAADDDLEASKSLALVERVASGIEAGKVEETSSALVLPAPKSDQYIRRASSAITPFARKAPKEAPKPKWHAPWKLMRVISGHMGWVRALHVEPGNEWFVTGAADRTIKIWDLASGTLKLTLTGHVNCIRGLAVSPRHPYLFSAAEDKEVKCWDLEYNKVIRRYHGHLSGVYCLALHPTLDVLITGGRDCVARVWDMRSKQQIHSLGGHSNTVCSLLTQSVDPQVITGSMDQQVKLWDLAAGKSMVTLTNHKKSVRALAMHDRECTFVSGAADNIKKWQSRDGTFLQNFSGHNSIVNALAVNEDDVCVSGGDDGSLRFWDYNTGYAFQDEVTRAQPGSLDSEAGIYSMTFDRTGSRLITGEADKTIKVWKEDESATPESHPIDMKAWTQECRRRKRY